MAKARIEKLTTRLDYTRACIESLLDEFDKRASQLDGDTRTLADALRASGAKGAGARTHMDARQRCRAWWRAFIALADLQTRAVNGELRAGPARNIAPPLSRDGLFRYESERLAGTTHYNKTERKRYTGEAFDDARGVLEQLEALAPRCAEVR